MIDRKNNLNKVRCERCKYYHTLKHDFRTGQGFRMSHACTVRIETKEGDDVLEVVPYDMCEKFTEKGEED